MVALDWNHPWSGDIQLYYTSPSTSDSIEPHREWRGLKEDQQTVKKRVYDVCVCM